MSILKVFGILSWLIFYCFEVIRELDLILMIYKNIKLILEGDEKERLLKNDIDFYYRRRRIICYNMALANVEY